MLFLKSLTSKRTTFSVLCICSILVSCVYLAAMFDDVFENYCRTCEKSGIYRSISERLLYSPHDSESFLIRVALSTLTLCIVIQMVGIYSLQPGKEPWVSTYLMLQTALTIVFIGLTIQFTAIWPHTLLNLITLTAAFSLASHLDRLSRLFFASREQEQVPQQQQTYSRY